MVYLRAVKESLTKGKKVALITKQKQLNTVESTANQNNQIKPCTFVLTVQQHDLSAEIFNTNDRTHPTL